jgi:hypothetical protein
MLAGLQPTWMTPSNDCPPADLREVAWPGRWLFLMENDSFSSRAVKLQNELAAMVAATCISTQSAVTKCCQLLSRSRL